MTIVYHPDFPRDIQNFAEDYEKISMGLAARFRREIDDALARIKAAPQAAGHFLNT